MDNTRISFGTLILILIGSVLINGKKEIPYFINYLYILVWWDEMLDEYTDTDQVDLQTTTTVAFILTLI